MITGLKRLLIVTGLALASCGGEPGQQITIASMPTGTNVYTVSAGLAKAFQENLETPATIRPFSGSSVYIPMLHRGEVSLGLNTSVDGYLSYRGLAPYEAPMSNLRTLGMVFPLNIAFMARADSGLESIEDLRGQRVLDAGCGTGRISLELARHVKSVQGVDFSPRSVEVLLNKAREADVGNVEAEVGDITDIKQEGGQFDLAVSVQDGRGMDRFLVGTLRANPFPDATPAFFRSLSRTLSLALGRPVRVAAPFARKSKAAVRRMAEALPLRYVFSCLNPRGGRPCPPGR